MLVDVNLYIAPFRKSAKNAMTKEPKPKAI